jgi:dTDP-4-dehydro-6-deoxy-alpha-D-glucopyranose 2,3-dehydratase
VQISPTLQATKSNYTRVHGGKSPAYLEHFLNAPPSSILLDQLQSEQGARFLSKRNRNIIVEAAEPPAALDGFRWLTLGQIKRLLREPNTINMDTRTVISGISYGEYDERAEYYFEIFSELFPPSSESAFEFLRSFLHGGTALHGIDELISWVSHLRSRYELRIRPKPLGALTQWVLGKDEIYHEHRKFFRVVGADVRINGREVGAWSQPLIESAQEGIIAFLIKKIDGVYHFLVQAKLEPGNFDIIEFAPSVQCLTGNYRETPRHLRPAFLDDLLDAPAERILLDTMQSEEGGRFFREQNRNMMVLVADDFPIDCGENFRWMTLNQIKLFIRFNNYLNMQARSLLSAISFS